MISAMNRTSRIFPCEQAACQRLAHGAKEALWRQGSALAPRRQLADKEVRLEIPIAILDGKRTR